MMVYNREDTHQNPAHNISFANLYGEINLNRKILLRIVAILLKIPRK
ncbi:hypothetical protein N39L_13350 [Limnospira platensis NIES-39]|uniref:Uncharacterized protein n=1 Tax=Limnospira platensis NIES-46 TaxID=1236695 RepID=A0A5M3T1U1_LIMPL|nr:hypothetical protein N39L_13350 [Arthrospira platensis NIES-39]GCE93564.1 hypothetical protein NIES46_16150 [Arthrospira platensis NIES-46]